MIVIMTVIRSFGNAEDATMIIIIRVIILILMMIVIIVIAFIIVIMIFFYLSSIYISKAVLGILGNAEDATMIVIMTVIRSFGNAEATISHHPSHIHDGCHHSHRLHHRHHEFLLSFFSVQLKCGVRHPW